MIEYICSFEEAYGFLVSESMKYGEELIRCKDCKNWWESAQMCTIAELPTGSSCSAEDYCSKAERKDND